MGKELGVNSEILSSRRPVHRTEVFGVTPIGTVYDGINADVSI